MLEADLFDLMIKVGEHFAKPQYKDLPFGGIQVGTSSGGRVRLTAPAADHGGGLLPASPGFQGRKGRQVRVPVVAVERRGGDQLGSGGHIPSEGRRWVAGGARARADEVDDAAFIKMLNEARMGKLSPKTVAALRRLERPCKCPAGLVPVEL